MGKIEVINENVSGTLESTSTRWNTSARTTIALSNARCCNNQRQKLCCIILPIAAIILIIISVTLPVVIIGKNKGKQLTSPETTASALSSSSTTITSTSVHISSTSKATSRVASATTELPFTSLSTLLTTGSTEKIQPSPQELVQISLDTVDGIIMGIYNTTVGGNSLPATAGNGVGQYVVRHPPSNACDNNIKTKYQSFGWCSLYGSNASRCGYNTGLYFELESGATLIIGLRICEGLASRALSPNIVSLEGSNQSGIDLTLGASWTLIYQGSAELNEISSREDCGRIITFTNTVRYSSYRFLVLETVSDVDSTEYSEVQLYTNSVV
ncbi:unnamed protein product [Adineta ricciae]|uniref:Uncharacterized protein n=1 Tax=Adineta ricciae TaxID=249248 RepID=A0A815NUM6_ADIRI|nr:unnamed protein product [Adineta ricciae]CAF1438633.1 unnamed protein product [Adineta ricciae]